MNCLFCNKDLATDNPKARYCSEAHSKAYRRKTQSGQEPGQNDPDIVTRTIPGLTRTDQLFENLKPGYYRFSDDTRTIACLQCGKQFKTHLKLLRQCSPKCMREMITI